MASSHPELGNPSSLHSAGRRSRSSLQQARDQIAASIGAATSDEITFTSSGTESIQLALTSILETSLSQGRRPHLITSAVEHEATHLMAEAARARGAEVSFLELDEQGRPRADSLERIWRRDIPGAETLVSLIWVNNETGVINDVVTLARKARELGAWVHLDGAQAWGKIPVNVRQSGAHAVSFSAHKIGGLAGTGVLWSERDFPMQPLLRGRQEQGRRGGTENFVGAMAAGIAAGAAVDELQQRMAEIEASRNRLEALLRSAIDGILVNGEGAPRVGNTLNISIKDIDGTGLVQALDLDGFALSAGAACSSGVPQPSRILTALGRDRELAKASLRISLSEPLPEVQAKALVESLARNVARLRSAKGRSAS